MKVSEPRPGIASTSLASPFTAVIAAQNRIIAQAPVVTPPASWRGIQSDPVTAALTAFLESSETISAALPDVDLGAFDTITDLAKFADHVAKGSGIGMLGSGVTLAKSGLDAAFPDNPAIGAAHAAVKFGLACHKGDTGKMVATGLGLCGKAFEVVEGYGLYNHPYLSVAAHGFKAGAKVVTIIADGLKDPDQIAAFKVSTASA